MVEQTIPVVDLNDFLKGSSSQKDDFVNTVGQGLTDLGFFAIENHGVDHKLIEQAYGLAKAFFEQDVSVKAQYEDPAIKGQRGYVSFGKEKAKDANAPDLKEFWHVGQSLPEGHELNKVYPANVWPSELPEFKPVFQQLYKQLDVCAQSLLKACALYLGENETLFSDMATDGNSILRVIHYPPIAEDANPASIRAAAHEDINLITLLCESTDEGLELLQKDGNWRPIHALNGQIVVDTGDMIQNVTNGILKSTTHRVVNPNNDRSQRFSMPFFVHARSEVDLSPLASCVEKTGGKKLYPDQTAGEYLNQRLKEIGLA